MRSRFADRRSGPDTRRVGTLSDEALIAGVAVGEPDAIDEFLTRFQRRVYGAALAISRDVELAQEITQDTFVRVWRHAATYDPVRGTVVTWLLRITHNVSVDALRVRRPVAIDPESFDSIVDHRPGPARVGDATVEVRAALRDLPGDQARSVVMAAMYGYTAQQISELDDVPLGTAKTRIRLGLDKLRSALADSDLTDFSTKELP
ncbi:MAG: sigma-70 family RNA polymerase sigma factor [Actinomycetota bacterium]